MSSYSKSAEQFACVEVVMRWCNQVRVAFRFLLHVQELPYPWIVHSSLSLQPVILPLFAPLHARFVLLSLFPANHIHFVGFNAKMNSETIEFPISGDKMACTMNQFRRHDVSRRNRLGVQYQIEETGIARLIFEEDGSGFMGMLLNQNDESVSVRGTLAPHTTPFDPMSASTSCMTVFVVDGEAGNQFRIDNVEIVAEAMDNPDSRPGARPKISIKNGNLFFVTKDVLIGNRADVEIQTYLDPRLAQTKRAVYVGQMRIQMKANEKISPSIRRESLCENCSTQILEESEDFFA